MVLRITLGAIQSDAGLKGLPCWGSSKQDKHCIPDVISNISGVRVRLITHF